MNKNELIALRNHIIENVGNLSVTEMLWLYETIMNGSDGYILGAEYDGMVYGYHTDHIPEKYCSCQTDHKTNNQYLRFRPHLWGSREIANRSDVICYGSTKEVYTYYTCNTKSGYNSGYCFEIAVYKHHNRYNEWVQDNKASTEGGDITLNGKEIQMKFVEKNHLATITSTAKIVRRIDKILEIMA